MIRLQKTVTSLLLVLMKQAVLERLLGQGGEGNGNPLQYSCLENPRDRGAWWASVYWVAQSRTRLTRLNSSSSSKHSIQAQTRKSEERGKEREGISGPEQLIEIATLLKSSHFRINKLFVYLISFESYTSIILQMKQSKLKEGKSLGEGTMLRD